MRTTLLGLGVFFWLVSAVMGQGEGMVKQLASFEKENPFTTGDLIREFPTDRVWPIVRGEIVSEHASDGGKALKVSDGALILQGPMDWRGYDFLKVDVFNGDSKPQRFGIEAQDKNSANFWQQILYTTVLQPGANTVALPLDHIRHGGKSRPKMPVDLGGIRLLALKVYNPAESPVFLDNLRLEKETRVAGLLFEGLRAFDLGSDQSPVMAGFQQLDAGMTYTSERGYGLKDAKLYGGPANRYAFDGFQPDPLYRDFLAIEKGGIAIDLPNGQYRVFVNLDSPSGYWGEYQYYRNRKVLAEGKTVVDESMDFTALKDRYFRHFADEDLPGVDVFDRYVKPYFAEKTFDVTVSDGQLNLEFDSTSFGCSVSAVVVYPVEKAEQGQKFLDGIAALRKWHFNNDFKKVLPTGGEERSVAAEADRQRGLVLFNRDPMAEVGSADRPGAGDQICQRLTGRAMAGQSLPLEFSLVPLKDLGKVTLTAGDLTVGDKAIAAKNIEIGHVSYRVTRQNLDGTIYTVAPRLVLPYNAVNCPADITRRFWLCLSVPKDATPGTYKGEVKLACQNGPTIQLPVELTVLNGALDEVDIPVGPFGHTISIPWYGADEPAKAWNERMAAASFAKLKADGFTAVSGLPVVTYKGFDENRQPILDFSVADRQMKQVREAGFTMPFISYCQFNGLNLYTQDVAAMKKAGFDNYSEFLKAIFTAVQQHAEANNWRGVYWNLGDEPAGKEDLEAAVANMEVYRKAFPQGPPYFTFCGSYTETDEDDPHFRLSKAAHVAAWNLHTEASINLLKSRGGQWAFYNGGNRWTFGTYMFKAAKQFDMKFRPCWHWNIVVGDPYYGLDCREDDFAWCNSSPEGELIPTLFYERLREGLTDYRALLTLSRLAKEHAHTDAGKAAQKLIDDRMNAFKLGQRDHDALFGREDYQRFRDQLLTAIDGLSAGK